MEKLKWETKKVKIKDLIKLDINPRKIFEDKKKRLIESLDKFNLVEIPYVFSELMYDSQTDIIILGNVFENPELLGVS